MTKVAIVTDSTVSMPEHLVEQYAIRVAPQVVIWNEETLLDGIDISAEEFYDRLQREEHMPTTSQTTIGKFKQVFEELVEQGQPIAVITVGEKLSGTYQSAVQAKAMLPDAEIEVHNSDTAAMALGFQVLAAARAADEGATLAQVIEAAQATKDHTGVLLVMETLEFLHRGGRIGGAARLLGTALNLKPILEITDGQVEPVERVRTKSKAVSRMIDLLAERSEGKSPIRFGIHHAHAEDEAFQLRDRLQERFSAEEMYVTILTPSVGVHTGPGTLGVTYSFGM